MLVLSRRIGETLIIGDDIEVTVLDVVHGQVRLGIKAPREVNIVRGELLLRSINKAQLVVDVDEKPLTVRIKDRLRLSLHGRHKKDD